MIGEKKRNEHDFKMATWQTSHFVPSFANQTTDAERESPTQSRQGLEKEEKERIRPAKIRRDLCNLLLTKSE